jgi:enamine deaminase RidA (YjgF/YER057c/UK114 family)
MALGIGSVPVTVASGVTGYTGRGALQQRRVVMVAEGEGMRISSGSPFEEEFAYSRAVARGDWCFVAGTTGYDYATMSIPDSALDQARNAFATIAARSERRASR